MLYFDPSENKYVILGDKFSKNGIDYSGREGAEFMESLGFLSVIDVGEPQDSSLFNNFETISGRFRTITSTPKDPQMIISDNNKVIMDQIRNLELSELLPRVIRTDLLARALKEIAESGFTPEQVYAMASLPDAPAAAIAYKKVKDFEDAIAVLREKLK